MLNLGTTIDSVVLLKWLKQVGDQVNQGELLCEVQTDKAVVEMESVAKGTLLKQVVAENTEISVGSVIAYIGEPGENITE